MTLTFDYAGQMAVLGPLSPSAEPSAYDLCARHAERTSVPRGWEVVRLAALDEPSPPPADDLLALADAIREVGLRHDDPLPAPPAPASVPIHTDDTTAVRRHADNVVVGPW